MNTVCAFERLIMLPVGPRRAMTQRLMSNSLPTGSKGARTMLLGAFKA